MSENVFNPLVAAETLTSDIRDAVLAEFKHMSKPWQQMSEDEQQRVINRSQDIADKLVIDAVDLIAGQGLPSLPIKVGKIVVEGSECKGTFECYADDEALLRIRHLQGSRAMFVLASPDAYRGETEAPKPDNVGDLAIPTTGRGSASDPGIEATIGRGHPADDLDVRTTNGGKLNRTNGAAAN